MCGCAESNDELNGAHKARVQSIDLGAFECSVQVEDPDSPLDGEISSVSVAKKTPDGKTHGSYAARRDQNFNSEG